jgi:hypothetical protein
MSNVFDEPFDCSKLVDLNLRQLDDLSKEYEMGMERIRGEIAKIYTKIEPYHLQIRDLKKRYKSLGLKFEATRAFAMVEKGGSLISNIDMRGYHKPSMEQPEIEEESDSPDTPDNKSLNKTMNQTRSKSSASLAPPKSPATKKGQYAGIKSKVVLNWIGKAKDSRDERDDRESRGSKKY